MKPPSRLIKQLPNGPGIYQFYDAEGKLIYVGKSVSIKKRVSSYFTSKNLGPKTNLLIGQIKSIKTIKVFSEFEALLLESELIRKNQPFFNIIAKDDKSPIYIKISNDEIPLISLNRKEAPKRGVFLKGPFPSTKVTKEILKMTRRIFPYCHHKNPKKPCLFVHLGLCPYPQGEEAKKQYQNTIKKIKKLLSGKSKKLIRELTAEMRLNSEKQQYEKAQKIKMQIQNLEYLTTVFHTPREFLERPTLVDDLALIRLKDVKERLSLKHVPQRIECYDISNFQGKQATGSMVVFKNGQPDKSQYRRFKIKFSEKPNDYLMLKEVLLRRFKNNWPTPDLIIIDGGKGQLNAAISVTGGINTKIQVVSLAKRLEEIYTPGEILPLSLPKESPARQLAQAIRDEAHRFAINYHRHLRSKQFLES